MMNSEIPRFRVLVASLALSEPRLALVNIEARRKRKLTLS
jgi:hypothetical protein